MEMKRARERSRISSSNQQKQTVMPTKSTYLSIHPVAITREIAHTLFYLAVILASSVIIITTIIN